MATGECYVVCITRDLRVCNIVHTERLAKRLLLIATHLVVERAQHDPRTQHEGHKENASAEEELHQTWDSYVQST